MAIRFDEFNKSLADYRYFVESYDSRLDAVMNDPLIASSHDPVGKLKIVISGREDCDLEDSMQLEGTNNNRGSGDNGDTLTLNGYDPVEAFKQILEDDRRKHIKNYEIEEYRVRKCFEQFTSDVINSVTFLLFLSQNDSIYSYQRREESSPIEAVRLPYLSIVKP